MIENVKPILQRLNFLLGRDPVLVKKPEWRDYIPDGYKAVVIISADFELAWASRYSKKYQYPVQKALEKARTERENIPAILSLCEKYNIPITWLTVGHLFLESCSPVNGFLHPEIERPGHFENEWWKFSGNDWFEHDPGTDFRKDPLWYSPDLIRMILDSGVKHEIGCHTFSHIDCRNEVCTPEQLKGEIIATLAAAKKFGIEKMDSFVHPGHTIGNLDTLASMGFTNYRTDYANILGYPEKHENGLWEFSTTLELEIKAGWPLISQINRYIDTTRRAVRNHSVAYFWFHPSCNNLLVKKVFPPFFKWLDENRDYIYITNQVEYVNWLNRDKKTDDFFK